MPNEREEKLKNLQSEKEQLISIVDKNFVKFTKDTKEIYDEKIFQIKRAMANLNKLNDDEKNIHVIWIGILPKGELDNLKVWTKYNPGYNIHIWTDLRHVLSHKLNTILFENAKVFNNGIEEHDYHLEANLKDEFYNDYQSKKSEKIFDENVAQFLLDKGYATKNEILDWVKEGNKKLLQEQKDIQKYTTNEVILHDVSQEKDSIFPNQKYYEGYLNDLEHLHICAGASDRLRYAILDKFGGVYLDTDVTMCFDLKTIKNNKKITNLINLVHWNDNDDKWIFFDKTDLIINQMVLLSNLKQLNDEQLKDFNEKWTQLFETNSKKNYKIFKKIAKEFKKQKSKWIPNMLLSQVSIDSSLQISCYHSRKNITSNAFIIIKKDSNFLQKVMKRIEATDERIKGMNTYQKLINKQNMVLYNTGPGNIGYTLIENDKNYFYLYDQDNSSILTLNSINSINSSWYVSKIHKDAIKRQDHILSYFLGDLNESENLNYDKTFKDKEQLSNSILIQREKDHKDEISLFNKREQKEQDDNSKTNLTPAIKKHKNSFEQEL